VHPVRDNGQVSNAERDVETSSDAPVPPGRPRRLGVFIGVAALALALDVISKIIVVADLGNRGPVRILGGAVYLTETRNSGAAFSVGTGVTIVLTLLALAVVGVILRMAGRMRSTGWALALGLVLGGALGNLTDRIFRWPGVGRGHVVDWISLFAKDGHVWPIFNLADSAIVCGAVLLAALALCGIEIDGRGARVRRGGHRGE
jgi:signal peptidase II